jgi:hypothetical protein
MAGGQTIGKLPFAAATCKQVVHYEKIKRNRYEVSGGIVVLGGAKIRGLCP